MIVVVGKGVLLVEGLDDARHVLGVVDPLVRPEELEQTILPLEHVIAGRADRCPIPKLQRRAVPRAAEQVRQQVVRVVTRERLNERGLRALTEEISSHAQDIDLGGHEGVEGVPWGAHDRIRREVEAGVDDDGTAAPVMERLEELSEQPVPAGIDRLHPRRVVHVRDRGDLRAALLELREARRFRRGVRAPAFRIHDRRDDQHVRALDTLGDFEELGRMLAEYGRSEGAEFLPELHLEVDRFLHLRAPRIP